MIKTLRITSIIAAFLAAGLFVFPAFFGFRSDKEIKELLSLPSVVEKFRQDQGDSQESSEGQISPLVAQAEAFGLYLNPPKPKRVVGPSRGPRKGEVVPPPPPRELRPKFNLIATSVYGSRPALSLALIDEPGKGRHWVRQASVVSHLTIEDIRDGLVVVRGAKGTFEISAEARPAQRSLLAGSGPVSTGEGVPVGSGVGPASVSSETEFGASSDTGITSSVLEQMSPEEEAALAAKIFAELAAMATEGGDVSDKSGSDYGTEEDSEALIAELEAMRISGREAKELGHLGEELDDVRQDPNRPKSQKVDKSPQNPPTRKARPRPTSKRRSKPRDRRTPKK